MGQTLLCAQQHRKLNRTFLPCPYFSVNLPLGAPSLNLL